MSEHGYLSDRRMIGMLLKKHVDVPPDALQEAVAGAVDDMRLSDNLRVKANARDFVLNVEKHNAGILELVLKAKIAPLERAYLRAKIDLIARNVDSDDDKIDFWREREALELERNNGWPENSTTTRASPITEQSPSSITGESANEDSPQPPSNPEPSEPPPADPVPVRRSRR